MLFSLLICREVYYTFFHTFSRSLSLAAIILWILFYVFFCHNFIFLASIAHREVYASSCYSSNVNFLWCTFIKLRSNQRYFFVSSLCFLFLKHWILMAISFDISERKKKNRQTDDKEMCVWMLERCLMCLIILGFLYAYLMLDCKINRFFFSLEKKKLNPDCKFNENPFGDVDARSSSKRLSKLLWMSRKCNLFPFSVCNEQNLSGL